MKVLVTGITGQLGFDVINELNNRGYQYIGCDTKTMNIIDIHKVKNIIVKAAPDAVIHCAAWTKVDDAEYNKEYVELVNFKGTKNIAQACKQIDCKMVYISTDYVFGGTGKEPIKADSKNFSPLNSYGQTKLEGEFAVSQEVNKFFIVRTSWLFGTNGNNFIKSMLRLGKKYDTIKVVDDQIGRPTYSRDLARLLVDMINTEKYGYYHATNDGEYISWYDFACEIFRQSGYKNKVIPICTSKYNLSKARRPLNSRLDISKLVASGFQPLPNWKDALSRYLNSLQD